ncbi:MAG TPA: hypothetical protein VGJ55_20255 [Pyrinomonadaceae bacterium]
MIGRWLCLTTLVLLALSMPACKGDAKSQIVGKWEATITHKRSGNVAKLLWEFLPDGTFTAAPLNDPGTIVDKDKYEIIDDGRSVKIRSQLIEDGTCTLERSTMTGETRGSLVKFKKL